MQVIVSNYLKNFTGREISSAAGDCREPVVRVGFPRSEDSWRLPLFLDGKAVKKDSGDGVHPGEVFGFVVLVCNVRYAHPHGFTPVARLKDSFSCLCVLCGLKFLRRTSSALKKLSVASKLCGVAPHSALPCVCQNASVGRFVSTFNKLKRENLF